MIAGALPHWLHWLETLYFPESGRGYAIGSSWAGATVIFTGTISAFITYWRHHECHVESPKNCHHFGHLVPGTAHRACRIHHPHAEEKGAVTADDILRHHEESGA